MGFREAGERIGAGASNWIVMALVVQFVKYDRININSNVLSSYLFD